MSSHHHPSLAEVLEAGCSDEWIELRIRRITLSNWIDPENSPNDRTNPSVSLVAEDCQSEYGTYNFQNVHVSIQSTSQDVLKTLNEKFPLGSINYYEEGSAHFNVVVDETHVQTILDATLRDPSGLRFRVAIPIWEDTEAKCLPLIQNQVFYTASTGGENES